MKKKVKFILILIFGFHSVYSNSNLNDKYIIKSNSPKTKIFYLDNLYFIANSELIIYGKNASLSLLSKKISEENKGYLIKEITITDYFDKKNETNNSIELSKKRTSILRNLIANKFSINKKLIRTSYEVQVDIEKWKFYNYFFINKKIQIKLFLFHKNTVNKTANTIVKTLLKKETVLNNKLEEVVEYGLKNKLVINKNTYEQTIDSDNSNQKSKNDRIFKMPLYLREKDVVLVKIKDINNNLVNSFSKKIETYGNIEIDIPTQNLKKGKYTIFVVSLNGGIAKGNLEIN